MLTVARISGILLEFGFNAATTTDGQICHKILKYIDLLNEWNKKVSLTSITGNEEIIRRLFGESLYVLSLMGIADGRLADVGSGAGFPAIPIKLACPGIDIDLYEPNAKKFVFLNEVIRNLDLHGARVIRRRIEDVAPAAKSLRFVSTRGVSGHENILSWAGRGLMNGGEAMLWVGEDDSRKIGKVKGYEWRDPELLPGREASYIMIGRRAGQAVDDP